MKHVGDITKLNGYNLEPVDVVTGGSPCQDLSVAGKREGLAGERSGLFMEQIRVIKETRETDEWRGFTKQFIRPRYMVWENVPGALSSNKGEDFRAVLDETARIVEENAVIPQPPKGKWRNAGAIMGNGWSIAWRVLDAQFWGVPQRRRRIALIADFGGQSAPEILFVRESLQGDFAESGVPGARTPRTTERSVAIPVLEPGRRGEPGQGYCLRIAQAGSNGWGVNEDVAYTLDSTGPCAVCHLDRELILAAGFDTQQITSPTNRAKVTFDAPQPTLCKDGRPHVITAGFKSGQGAKAGGIGYQEEVAPALMSSQTGGNMVPAIVYTQKKYGEYEEGVGTLTTTAGAGSTGETLAVHQNTDSENAPLLFENHRREARYAGPLNVSPTCVSKWGTGGNNTPLVMSHGQSNAEITENVCPTLNCNHEQPIIKTGYRVRRLTPLECERLQGYPDGWTAIPDYIDATGRKKTVSDTARYKALGNSIALPPWKWILKRISAQYERDATLGSLFDGIGGFSYLWEQINGKGSALWASEIEPFCIAVTEYRLKP